MKNNSLLADALAFGFETLKGQTLEGKTSTGESLNQVRIQEIVGEIEPKRDNKGWINFKIIALEGGKEAKIGVAVIQNSQFSLVAGLKRLNDYGKYDLTRGCLVRSPDKVKTIKKNSKAHQLLERLTTINRGEYVGLVREQIEPLLAVHAVEQKKEKYNLDSKQILALITSKQITAKNELLLEILSDPSGEVPEVEEDLFEELTEDTNHENSSMEAESDNNQSNQEDLFG